MTRPHSAACLIVLLAASTAIANDDERSKDDRRGSDTQKAGEPPVPKSPNLQKFLRSGRLVEGEQALMAAIVANPEDDRARFGLGFLRVVRSAERFGQSLHEYGATPNGTRLPIAANPDPAPISYQRFRRVLDQFRRDLVEAEETLAGIDDDDVTLPVRLARIRLDLDGDGEPTDEFIELLGRVMRQQDFPFLKENADFLVRFDRGDVAWLRGYCHLLCGVLDGVLAFDTEAEFRRTVERNFANPAPFKGEPKHDGRNGHCVEPLRLARTRRHFVAVCTLNEETWKHVRLETDDDHEWLPHSKQTGVLGLPVTEPMIDAWLGMARELKATLEGERTFLRIFIQKNGLGLNLKKLLDEPPRTWNAPNFPLSLPDRYFSDIRDMDLNVLMMGFRAFRGSPIGYAIWFN